MIDPAVSAAVEILAAAGVPSPRYDALELAVFVAGVPRSRLASLTDDQRGRFDALVARRVAREPLQHITGQAPFRHLVLAVGPGVFVPRPETEGLVDLVLADCGPARVAVDLCAGSGAIAASIATEAPGTEVHAVEVSPEALVWLRRNGAGVVVHEADVAGFTGIAADVVVSNPPYLPAGIDVDPEVAADPPLALWGGADGLALIPTVIDTAARLLGPGGLVALEHDVSHQADVMECLRHKGFDDVRGHRDLTGRDRYATGRKMHP